MVTERPSKDRRKIAEELLGYWVRIKMFQLFVGGLRKCADFQVVRYCGKEGTKKAYRREKE